MRITVQSIITGVKHTRNIPGLDEDMIAMWKAGEDIENAMPDVCDEDRAFIISGITDDEWNKAFVEELF